MSVFFTCSFIHCSIYNNPHIYILLHWIDPSNKDSNLKCDITHTQRVNICIAKSVKLLQQRQNSSPASLHLFRSRDFNLNVRPISKTPWITHYTTYAANHRLKYILCDLQKERVCEWVSVWVWVPVTEFLAGEYKKYAEFFSVIPSLCKFLFAFSQLYFLPKLGFPLWSLPLQTDFYLYLKPNFPICLSIDTA